MTTGAPRKRLDIRMGAFALSHWELLALLKLLRISAIPGQDDDGVVPRSTGVAPEKLADRVRVAAEDLEARGFATVSRTSGDSSGASNAPTVVIATPVLALLGVCASSRYSIRIMTTVKGQRVESYLHEWMGLGAVHTIEPGDASHLFLPVAGRQGILDAVEALTDAESGARASVDALGVMSVSRFRETLAAAAREGVSGASRILSAPSSERALDVSLQRRLAETLGGAERFDEIDVGVTETNTTVKQASAVRAVRGADDYLCANSYSDPLLTLRMGGRGAVAHWVATLLPER